MAAFAAAAPLITAGAGLVGDILGFGAADDANKLNSEISLMNYYEQVAARNRAENNARRQQNDARLGQTDGSGNRTYFVPGRGWVTELSDGQQQIHDASEQEQLRQLSQGARDERVQERANDRRNREDTQATEGEREFRSARRQDEASLRDLFLARGAQARNAQADRAGNAAARQNIRAGGRNAAELVQGARASADADSARQAGIEAALMAEGEADRRFAADRDAGAQLYDYFRKASTSGTAGGPTYNPTGPAAQSGLAANFGNQLIAASGQAPQRAYESGNFAASDLASGMGTNIGGLLSAWGGMQDDNAKKTNTGSFGK